MSLTTLNFVKKYFHTVNTLNLVGMPRKIKKSREIRPFYRYRVTGTSGTNLMTSSVKYLTFNH